MMFNLVFLIRIRLTKVIYGIPEDQIDCLVQINKCHLADRRKMLEQLAVRFNIIGGKHDLFQQRHTGAPCCVIPDRSGNRRIGYAVLFGGITGTKLRMKQIWLLFLGFVAYDIVLLALTQHFLVIKAFGAVVQKPCECCLIQIDTITHCQRNAGILYTDRMTVTLCGDVFLKLLLDLLQLFVVDHVVTLPLYKWFVRMYSSTAGGTSASTGGPSGGCLCISATEDHLDMKLDFDSLKKVGAMIGSGGLVVMNDKSCMVEVARFFMNFTQNESCGKCVPCREGTKRMLELLTDITEGRGTMEHIELLEKLADTISATALCGLGKTAASPVVSTLKYFRDEYVAHVVDKKCPAGQCKALMTYQIDPSLCRGCTKCARMCPVEAISGTVKEPHVIDTTKCIKCGACKEGCHFNAVKEV